MLARLRVVGVLLAVACVFLALCLVVLMLGTLSTDRLVPCLVCAGLAAVLAAPGLLVRGSTDLLVGSLDLVGRLLRGLAPLFAIVFAAGTDDHQWIGGAVVLVGVGGAGALAALPAFRRRRSRRRAGRDASASAER